MPRTYEIQQGTPWGAPNIKCLRCGVRSYHPKDIRERYCAKCHAFHDEPEGSAARPNGFAAHAAPSSPGSS